MHRSHIEAIIQKQITILGKEQVKKILAPIQEVQMDDEGRVVNLSRDDEEMLNQIITAFLDVSHEIVKGLIFEIEPEKALPQESGDIKPIEAEKKDPIEPLPKEVVSSSVDELVALAPDEPYKHSGSDSIEKALEDLNNRTSAEDAQSGPSNTPTAPEDPSVQPSTSSDTTGSQASGSVQKLNDLIKQYNV